MADTKLHHDARRLLAMTKDVTNTKPAVFITELFGKETKYPVIIDENGEMPLESC